MLWYELQYLLLILAYYSYMEFIFQKISIYKCKQFKNNIFLFLISDNEVGLVSTGQTNNRVQMFMMCVNKQLIV